MQPLTLSFNENNPLAEPHLMGLASWYIHQTNNERSASLLGTMYIFPRRAVRYSSFMVTMAGGYSGSPASELAKKMPLAIELYTSDNQKRRTKTEHWWLKFQKEKEEEKINFCYPRQMTNLPEVNAVQDNNLQRGESKQRGNLHCIFHLIQSA